MIYITFERAGPKFSNTTAGALAYRTAVQQHFLNDSLPQQWIGHVWKEDLVLQVLAPEIS
jgi:hypothetical protein